MRTTSASLLRLSRRIAALSLGLGLGLGLGACSDDGGTGSPAGGDGGVDAGGQQDSGGGDGGGGGDSGAPEPVNGCTTFEDRTAEGANRTLTWDFSITTSPDRCIRIKAGQTVTWEGSLEAHPLLPSGGDSPSPVSGVDTTTGEVTFPSAGTFGYVCDVHPAMLGAVEVVD
jgi:plastocyanin